MRALHASTLVLAATLAAGRVAAASVTVEPAFGYRIGDRIVAVSEVAVDRRARLDPESLPKAGRLHGWLALEEVTVEQQRDGLRIVRVFQVTASAPEPKLLYLPKAELVFRLDGRDLVEQLESLPVSVSPLAPARAVLRNGFGGLRPDRDVPPPRPERALQRAAWLAAALLALALLWLGLRALALRRRGYAPFAAAARKLGRMKRAGRGGAPAQAVEGAYRVMHEAFNEVAGCAVFSAQRDRFIAEHPHLAAEAGGVRAFFDRSDALFFGGRARAGAVATVAVDARAGEAAGRDDIAWLAGLARRLAGRERQGGG